MQETQKKTDKLGSSFKALTGIVSFAVLAQGLNKVVQAASEAVEISSRFQKSMGTLETEAERFVSALSDKFSLNPTEVKNYTATLNEMLKGMHVSSKEAAEMSMNLTKLTYDMSSFRDKKPEEIFEKISAAMTGEADGLKRIGILTTETAIKNTALTEGIIKQGEQLTELQKVKAKVSYYSQFNPK